MVNRNVAAGHLSFTTDVEAEVHFGEIQFIAVCTPPDEDGYADLSFVVAAARNIGRYMQSFKLVVSKSTVLVGTAEKVPHVLVQGDGARGVANLCCVLRHQPIAFLPDRTAVQFLGRLQRHTQQGHGADAGLGFAVGQDVFAHPKVWYVMVQHQVIKSRQHRLLNAHAGVELYQRRKARWNRMAEQVRFDFAQVLHGNWRHGARQLPLAPDEQAPERT